MSYSSSPSFHPLAVVPPPNAPPPALLAAETGEQNLCEALVSSVRACIYNEVAHFSGDPVPEQAFVNENGKWVGADEAQTPEQVVEAKEEAIKAEAQAKAAKARAEAKVRASADAEKRAMERERHEKAKVQAKAAAKAAALASARAAEERANAQSAERREWELS